MSPQNIKFFQIWFISTRDPRGRIAWGWATPTRGRAAWDAQPSSILLVSTWHLFDVCAWFRVILCTCDRDPASVTVVLQDRVKKKEIEKITLLWFWYPSGFLHPVGGHTHTCSAAKLRMWNIAPLRFENGLRGLATAADWKDGGSTVSVRDTRKQFTRTFLTMLPDDCCCRPCYGTEPG